MHELRRNDFWQRPSQTDSLIDLVGLFSTVRALVIGDAMVDQYHFGRVERISPEAPVPIFLEDSTESRRGGADNVAHQMEALGCRVKTVFAKRWSIKHRYFAAHHQIFRCDDDFRAGQEDVDDACRHIAAVIQDYDVIVLSDYAKGLITPELCQEVIRSRKRVVVDPKGRDWSKYRGAAVICPNEHELSSHSSDGHFGHIVAKLGSKGLALRTHDGVEHLRIPALAKQVFDVTGAGDVVTALIAAGTAVDASMESAAIIANHAAGIVVGKLGTAVCQREELMESLIRA